MKILIISQYFPPETGAGAARISYNARYLKSKGYEVTVLCGVPNYPTGNISPGYKNWLWHKEYIDGVTVYRTLVYPTKYSSNIRRLINYLVFMLSSFFVGLFLRKPDLIIASSPPPSAAISGYLLSVIKRTKLIFEVRDVWPGAALALGKLENKTFLKINLYLEKKVYEKSKYVIVTTYETRKIILEENPNLSDQKVQVVANGVDLDFFDSAFSKVLSRNSNTSSKKHLTLVYAGTLGLQQNVKDLVSIIRELKNAKNITFVIIGEGADRRLLEEEIKNNKLKNVRLMGILAYSEAIDQIGKADIGITILKKNKYLDAAYSVKAFDYMAAGKPILVSGGEAMGRLVETEKAGFSVPAEDKSALLSRVVEISKKPKAHLEQMGTRGRKLVELKFNRKKQAEILYNLIKDLEK